MSVRALLVVEEHRCEAILHVVLDITGEHAEQETGKGSTSLLVCAGEGLDLPMPVVSGNAAKEFVSGDVIHDLGKNQAAGKHWRSFLHASNGRKQAPWTRRVQVDDTPKAWIICQRSDWCSPKARIGVRLARNLETMSP